MQHLNKDKVEILIKSIAQTVKEQRQNLCKSQRLLADEFAIQKSLLSRLENANNEPKIGSLWMVAEALGRQNFLKWLKKNYLKILSC